MDKNDIIMNDKNFIEFSCRIESYLSEISDYFCYQTYTLKEQADKLNINIKKLQEDLETVFVKDEYNYNLFTPDDKHLLDKKEKIKAEKALYELKFNDYSENIGHLNNNVNHINDIKDYIIMLENIIKQYNITSQYTNSTINNEQEYKGLQILQNQEFERKRIARELHDSTVQNLTSLIHKTELCSRYVDIDPIRTKLELEIMKKTLRTTINDMREMIFDLRPMSLDDLGIVPTVQRYIEQLMENSEINITFDYTEDDSNIYSIIHLTLFRFIQEACNNVLKHAYAKNIKISLTNHKSEVHLIIEDDGIGFNVESYTEKTLDNSNFGLSIMKERVYLLSGQIHIESKKNRGTKISIIIPMNNCMEEKK